MGKLKKRNYPHRDKNSVLEGESERLFRNQVPPEWIIDKPIDYGIDLIVTPVLGGNVVGLNFSVQLKAQHELKGKWETRLKKTTLNFLFNRLEPVMVVLYDKKTGESRWKWLLASDFDLTKDVASYAIRFEKQQTISSVDWNAITDFVQQVFKVKNQLLTSLEYDLFNTKSELEGKAWSHYFTGNHDEASFYFKRLIQNPDPKSMWFLAMAQCQYYMYDYRSAIVHINKALELETDDVFLLTKGCILAEDGIRNNDAYKLAEAEKIFSDLYTRHPNAVHAYNLANTISKFNKLKEAEVLYKFALKANPNYAEAWKNLGQIYYDLRKHEDEIKCYDKALSINPDLYQATISKAITKGFIYHQYKNSLKEILATIQKQPRTFSEFPVIYYWLGFFYYKIKDVKESMYWINKGLSNNPGHSLLINLKSKILSEVIEEIDEFLPDAISFFTENYQRNDRDPVNFYHLCKCISKKEDKEKAYEMAIAWLNNQTITQAFQNISNDQLTYEEAMLLMKVWGYIQSYIIQYPAYRLEVQLENEGITRIETFVQLFEIKRFLFIAYFVELLAKVPNPKTVRKKVSAIFHQSFLKVPEILVCNMITVPKTDVQEFAQQFANVALTISNLYLVEISRCVGHTVGQRNIESEKKIMHEAVDPALFQVTLLFYTEALYRHFQLPIK